MEEKIVAMWEEVKGVMTAIELDVLKNARGTAAAGVRARKGLRTLKAKVAGLVKVTVELDKQRKAVRAEARAAKKKTAVAKK
jgi:hypothetical protein